MLTITILCTGRLCSDRLTLGTELCSWERHGLEYTARVIVLGRNTFLIGHGIFCRIDKVLSGTNNSHHREKSDGDSKILSASVTVIQNTVHPAGNGGRNVASGTAAAMTFALGLHYASTENDRLNHIHHSRGKIFGACTRLGYCTIVGRRILGASEGADLVIAAEQHHALFQNGNTVKLLRMTSDTCFKGQFDKEFDIDRVKSTVKSDRINGNVCGNKLGIANADRSCMLNDLVAEIGQKHADVFKAITVAAGIQNSIGLDTNQVSARLVAKTARKSVFRHRFLLHNYSMERGTRLLSIIYYAGMADFDNKARMISKSEERQLIGFGQTVKHVVFLQDLYDAF